MAALFHQLAISLRLHARNKMALLYSYLFPTIFLVAFWVLYRFEQVPLVRHVGELLTVTALGGACFGLPTTMVSERERGVWRRYRLTPVSTATLVAGTVAARYLLLVVAALLQLALAMGLGMPLPRHPIDLFVAFTLVAFAFIGLGLVIAMMADTVPAVQALGQCIFLPMLIIGGVAVPLASLPDWAQRLSGFFPGRYAVETLQACVTGDGLGAARFSALALVVIGLAGCVAGAKMFRWDSAQRFATAPGKGWVAVALAAWVGRRRHGRNAAARRVRSHLGHGSAWHLRVRSRCPPRRRWRPRLSRKPLPLRRLARDGAGRDPHGRAPRSKAPAADAAPPTVEMPPSAAQPSEPGRTAGPQPQLQDQARRRARARPRTGARSRWPTSSAI